MEVPRQCLSSFPTKHPAAVLSILSSVPFSFMELNDEEYGIKKRSKQVDGDLKLVLSLSKNTAFYSFMSLY